MRTHTKSSSVYIYVYVPLANSIMSVIVFGEKYGF